MSPFPAKESHSKQFAPELEFGFRKFCRTLIIQTQEKKFDVKMIPVISGRRERCLFFSSQFFIFLISF